MTSVTIASGTKKTKHGSEMPPAMGMRMPVAEINGKVATIGGTKTGVVQKGHGKLNPGCFAMLYVILVCLCGVVFVIGERGVATGVVIG